MAQTAHAALGIALWIIGGLVASLAGTGAVRAAVPIMTCPYSISAPGSYVVAADLSCLGDGIAIGVSHVTLILDGHIIIGNGVGGGIIVETASGSGRISDIQIQGNGLVQNFAFGIDLSKVDNSQIQQVVAALNAQAGIRTNQCTNLRLNENVFARSNGDGLDLMHDSNDQVKQNEATGNNIYGIYDFEGSGNQLYDNNDNGNSASGINIVANNDQIHDNTVFGNGGNGIIVESPSAANNIHDNTSEGNVGYDLQDTNSTPCGTNSWHNNRFFTANPSCVD